MGKASSLVIDMGGKHTTVSAVHDGYALQKSVVHSPLGGDALSGVVAKYLENQKIDVRPRCAFREEAKERRRV